MKNFLNTSMIRGEDLEKREGRRKIEKVSRQHGHKSDFRELCRPD